MKKRLFMVTAWTLLFSFLSLGWSLLLGHIGTKDLAVGAQVGLIRLHVLANSDSERDQQLKLRVRDSVIAYLAPYLEPATNVQQARQIVLAQQQQLAEIAKKTIAANGYDYPVTVQIGDFDFPLKAYGNLVLPAGKYEAVRILIGKAEGKNWWCVLFPPLCFIDMTNATAVQTAPPAGEKTSESNSSTIHYKWKIAELLCSAFHRP